MKMTKILAISDTHLEGEELPEAIAALAGRVGASGVLHHEAFVPARLGLPEHVLELLAGRGTMGGRTDHPGLGLRHV